MVTDVAKIVKWSVIEGYRVRKIQCKHVGSLKRKIMVTDVAKIVLWGIEYNKYSADKYKEILGYSRQYSGIKSKAMGMCIVHNVLYLLN
jgi:hypothetical protein